MEQARSDYGGCQAKLGRIRAVHSRLGIESRLRTASLCSVVGKLSLILCLLVSIASARQVRDASGNVEVNVVVKDSAGAVSSVALVIVRLEGPTVAEGETDENGKCPFSNVRPGKYVIEVSSPGFEGSRSAFVKPGETLEIELELSPAEIKSSVTVTADAAEGKQASPSATIDDKVLENAPNANDRFESALPLIPGVVRGPDGRINLKGARTTQSGALVNSANVTDPATGSPAINVPIDVISSVQVISNPYDPQYGKLTGAVSTVETKTGEFEKLHFSVQNLFPRLRDRDGTIRGIGASTPRATFTGPLIKNRLAITQSFEYRYVRTPVNSLPALQRDTKLESFDSYTQADIIINPKQTATVSFALYPQKLDYFGLNTFTPQPSTPDFHQRGYQINVQHRYLTGERAFDYVQPRIADVTAQSDDLYWLRTRQGDSSTDRLGVLRVLNGKRIISSSEAVSGSHKFKVSSHAHSSYEGRETFSCDDCRCTHGHRTDRLHRTVSVRCQPERNGAVRRDQCQSLHASS
jgi:hypothetical protein